MAAPDAGTTFSFRGGPEYQRLVSELHEHLLERIDEERVDVESWTRQALVSWVEQRVDAFVSEHRIALNRSEFTELVRGMTDEISGLGPIQCLVDDDEISDILVNGHRSIFVERRGRLEQTDIRFIDDRHILRIVQRIVAPLGRRVDESSPMVDARLADGSRVNAVVPPIALDGPSLSIRKFRKEPLRAGDLLTYRTLDDAMLKLLRAAVVARCNVLISGGTGSGKTTLLNVLSQSIPEHERLITIEDAAELSLGHPHVVRLETRPPNLEGVGQVAARDILKNALRMRPDRIILGEVRGVEVIEMLQAMNTGHSGSMATIHANSSRDALARIEILVGFGGFSGSELTLRQNVASAIDLVVQIGRLASGERRVLTITEVTGVADGAYLSQDLFSYDETAERFVEQQVRPHHAGLRDAVDGKDEGSFAELGYA